MTLEARERMAAISDGNAAAPFWSFSISGFYKSLEWIERGFASFLEGGDFLRQKRNWAVPRGINGGEVFGEAFSKSEGSDGKAEAAFGAESSDSDVRNAAKKRAQQAAHGNNGANVRNQNQKQTSSIPYPTTGSWLDFLSPASFPYLLGNFVIEPFYYVAKFVGWMSRTMVSFFGNVVLGSVGFYKESCEKIRTDLTAGYAEMMQNHSNWMAQQEAFARSKGWLRPGEKLQPGFAGFLQDVKLSFREVFSAELAEFDEHMRQSAREEINEQRKAAG